MPTGFSNNIKNKVLLWSDRHCCLCKKPCGVDIQVHHILSLEEGGTNDLDNAIPLCYDCHAEVHTKVIQGNSIKPVELKRRRDQIYEEFTNHLVPPVLVELTQEGGREFPDIGFRINNVGEAYPIQVLVNIFSILDGEKIKFRNGENKYYSGKHRWNLNPQKGINGHFVLPEYMMPENFSKMMDEEKTTKKLELRVQLNVIDILGRKHLLLPEGYIYAPSLPFERKWYSEP